MQSRSIPCAGCHGPVGDISGHQIQPHPMFPSLTVVFCRPCAGAEPPTPKPKVTAPLQRSDSGLSIKTPPNRDDCYHCGDAFLVEDREESAYCSATCEYLSRGLPVTHPRGAPRPSAAPCDCSDYEEGGWCTMIEGSVSQRPPTPFAKSPALLVGEN
jgi:hypothetical protein